MSRASIPPRDGAASASREALAAILPSQPVEVAPYAGLRTARMELRPLEARDREAYIRAAASSRAELQGLMPVHREGETDEQMFDRQLGIVGAEQARGQCFRCVGVMEDGQIAGGFNLNAISRGLEWQSDITWWVATPRVGRGLATEGVLGLLGHALADLPAGLGLHQVHAWITRENEASIRVAQKAGLIRQPEGQSYLNTGTRWAVHDKYTRRA